MRREIWKINKVILVMCLVLLVSCITVDDNNQGEYNDSQVFALDFEDGLKAQFNGVSIEPERAENVTHDSTTSSIVMGTNPKLLYLLDNVFPNVVGSLTMKLQGPHAVPLETTMLFAVFTDVDNRIYVRLEVDGENVNWHLYYRAKGVTSIIKTPVTSDLSEWHTVKVKWDTVNNALKLLVNDDEYIEIPDRLPAINITGSTNLTVCSYASSFSWPYNDSRVDYLRIIHE